MHLVRSSVFATNTYKHTNLEESRGRTNELRMTCVLLCCFPAFSQVPEYQVSEQASSSKQTIGNSSSSFNVIYLFHVCCTCWSLKDACIVVGLNGLTGIFVVHSQTSICHSYTTDVQLRTCDFEHLKHWPVCQTSFAAQVQEVITRITHEKVVEARRHPMLR